MTLTPESNLERALFPWNCNFSLLSLEIANLETGAASLWFVTVSIIYGELRGYEASPQAPPAWWRKTVVMPTECNAGLVRWTLSPANTTHEVQTTWTMPWPVNSLIPWPNVLRAVFLQWKIWSKTFSLGVTLYVHSTYKPHKPGHLWEHERETV